MVVRTAEGGNTWVDQQLYADAVVGISQSVSVRQYTLDVLARYIGYEDYTTFEEANKTKDEDASQPDAIESPKDKGTMQEEDARGREENHVRTLRSRRWLIGLTAVALLAVGSCLGMWWSSSANADDAYAEKYILRKGQRFPTYESYLKLFGITEPKGLIWSLPVPHYNNIIIFGGKYHHHHWGNEGDSAQLLPTRTEHWHDAEAGPEMERMQNSVHYYHQLEINRLAITFIKKLVDSGFVFCGVYRMSLEQSDTTHVVWERVADECDLLHLEALEHLHNWKLDVQFFS